MYITMKLILNMIFCLIIKIYTNFNMINKSIKNVNKRTYCMILLTLFQSMVRVLLL